MTITVYLTGSGDAYGLCSLTCKGGVEQWLLDPTQQKPEIENPANVGCWWCGADLTAGAVWL
jgi:hypothetical protein